MQDALRNKALYDLKKRFLTLSCKKKIKFIDTDLLLLFDYKHDSNYACFYTNRLPISLSQIDKLNQTLAAKNSAIVICTDYFVHNNNYSNVKIFGCIELIGVNFLCVTPIDFSKKYIYRNKLNLCIPEINAVTMALLFELENSKLLEDLVFSYHVEPMDINYFINDAEKIYQEYWSTNKNFKGCVDKIIQKVHSNNFKTISSQALLESKANVIYNEGWDNNPTDCFFNRSIFIALTTPAPTLLYLQRNCLSLLESLGLIVNPINVEFNRFHWQGKNKIINNYLQKISEVSNETLWNDAMHNYNLLKQMYYYPDNFQQHSSLHTIDSISLLS